MRAAVALGAAWLSLAAGPEAMSAAQEPARPATLAAAERDFRAEFEALATNRAGLAAADRLHALFDLAWERTMAWHPEYATYVGYAAGDHGAWTDESLDAIRAREARLVDPLDVLEAIPRDSLSPADQLNYDLFRRNIEEDVAGARFLAELLPLNQLGGVQQDVAQLLVIMPVRTVDDYEDILSRLDRVPRLVEQTIARLEAGLAQGLTPPRITLRDVPEQIENLLLPDPIESPMLDPFTDFPAAIPTAERERLREEAVAIFEERIVPAYRALHDYLVETYLPAAREEIAMTALPDGEAWYAFNVRRSTTTELTPEEIHETGKREVARIRAEMEAIVEETDFDGDLAAFNDFLRTDPRFYHTSAEDLLEGYRDISKRADPELTRLFGALPRLPYGVKPVPAYAEKSQTTAYYQPGSLESARPGWFYANTYALETRPIWEMEALTLHEAVPGHHLQIAIAQELDDVPEFRRHGGYTAFVEGWGLYAESLGEEMGFYQDPYNEYGRLTYEMWRAIRLVVDTGMHALGWTRQQAIDFFKANSGKSEHDITVEIDRYSVWPGQALAYKIGELRIQELRAEAERELGPRFDIRAFHDLILGEGALPLELLEARVRAWIADEKGAAVAGPVGSG
ncbi:MAG TPA: DUF885 domain-containing protein [Gemmatimonadota bacterium]|nr:DUF885 domain-containing protein [Gemmatimonadota bacterium]